MSGSSSATTISAIVSMQPTRRLSTPAVSPGTNSSPYQHASDQLPLAYTPKRSTHESVGISAAFQFVKFQSKSPPPKVQFDPQTGLETATPALSFNENDLDIFR